MTEQTMSKEQIEEMAKAMCLDCANDGPCNLAQVGGMCSSVRKQAASLYNAGYRKQSEAEWKEDIVAFCNVCSACKARVDRYAIKGNGGKLNFCPNCGARMKGGAE